MKSPLSVHQDLLGGYQEYLSKQFKSRNPNVTDGRKKLYETKGVTFQPPFLEFLFNYKSSGVDFRKEGSLVELNDYFGNEESTEAYRKFCSAGLMDYVAYSHQWDMLKKTLLESKNSIITTGTGSGKTESFILPLLAYLLKEMNNLGDINYATQNCYKRLYGNIFKRSIVQKHYPRQPEVGTQRKSAVRAIVLYPMNALVEDQLKRIRQALSRPEVLDVLDNHYGGNRIFYGKYTGMTAGSGIKNKASIDNARRRIG